MNRRNLLTRGIIGAMTIALPLVPAGAQQRLDVSRKAVTDDPVAPKRAGSDYDITIVEFFDYNCPYCRRMRPVLNGLLAPDPATPPRRLSRGVSAPDGAARQRRNQGGRDPREGRLAPPATRPEDARA